MRLFDTDNVPTTRWVELFDAVLCMTAAFGCGVMLGIILMLK